MAALFGALHEQLGEFFFFEDGDAGFVAIGVDDDFLLHWALGPARRPPNRSGAEVEQRQGIEAAATGLRPQGEPLDIGRAGIALREQLGHHVIGSCLGAQCESQMRVEHSPTFWRAHLERRDRGTGVEFAGLAIAAAAHDHLIAGQQISHARLEHLAERF
ncbi:MAG: hypothetical protein ACRDL7_13050, partial [Gaiellaceae bacterium]